VQPAGEADPLPRVIGQLGRPDPLQSLHVHRDTSTPGLRAGD
jgi:hypothetical protein